MKIPWWLHRLLMVISMLAGCAAGVMLAFYNLKALAKFMGEGVVVLLVIGFIVGGLLPYILFRKFIHAACPIDGKRMLIERVRLPKRYEQEVPRTGTRYRCPVCGTIK